MKRCHWAVVLVVLVLATATTASADPIRVIFDDRATNALADPLHGGSAEGASASDTLRSAATLDAGTRSGATTATLFSSYATAPLSWFGTGAADLSFTSPDTANYFAASRFSIRFEVNNAVNYNFNGSFTASSLLVPEASAALSAQAGGGLNGPGGLIFSAGPGSGTSTGILSPGVYALVLFARTAAFLSGPPRETGAANAGFAFTLDFTPTGPNGGPAPTPEPASLVLLGTGLAGVFRYRYRAQTHR